ncbi:MAG: hypothetical protein KC502_09745 [Myxococcales bacterium]|nr:hypothetical protein [Myxococcales bacterium]
MTVDHKSDQPEEAAHVEPEDLAHDKLRKNIAARLTRLLTSDEGVKTLVGAVVPKELISSTLDQVDATKSEAMAMVGRELRSFLDHLDVGEELAKILTAVSFEIRMEVRFIPNEDGTLRANVRGGAKPKVKVESRRDRKARQAQEEATAQEAAAAQEDAATQAESAAEVAPAESASAAHPAHAPAPAPTAQAPVSRTASEAMEDVEPAMPSEEQSEATDGERRPKRRLGRRALSSMVERVADAAATTARVAAEVAADAAAEVVNEARRNRADEDDLDSY